MTTWKSKFPRTFGEPVRFDRQSALEFMGSELAAWPEAVTLVPLLLGAADRNQPQSITDAGSIGLSAGQWSALLTVCENNRILGLLHALVQRGALTASQETSQYLAMALLKRTHHEAVLWTHADKLLKVAEDQGTRVLLLKGLATSLLDYADPSLRSFGDIDLLVPRDDAARFVAAIEQRGLSATRVGYESWELFKGLTLQTTDSYEFDIHFRFSNNLPEVSLDTLFSTPEVMTSPSGQPANALSPAGRLLHSCLHLVLTPPNHRVLSTAADIVAQREHRAEAHQLSAELGFVDLISPAFAVVDGLLVGYGDSPRPIGPTGRAIDYAFLRRTRNVTIEHLSVLVAASGTTVRLRMARQILRGDSTSLSEWLRHLTQKIRED